MNITITEGFSSEICIRCGVIFWVPDKLQSGRKKNKNPFYCPNGDQMAYVESESDRLNAKLLERDVELARCRSESIEFKKGLEHREAELVRLRARLKKPKKGKVKK